MEASNTAVILSRHTERSQRKSKRLMPTFILMGLRDNDELTLKERWVRKQVNCGDSSHVGHLMEKYLTLKNIYSDIV